MENRSREAEYDLLAGTGLASLCREAPARENNPSAIRTLVSFRKADTHSTSWTDEGPVTSGSPISMTCLFIINDTA